MKRLLLSLLALALLAPASALAGRQAWVSSNHIQVIDLDAGEVVGRIDLQEFIHDMAFSPDGGTAYIASSHGLRVADANTLELTRHPSQAATRGISLSADGSRLIAIHRAPSELALAARKAGKPLPPSTLAVYNAPEMVLVSSFGVPGNAFDTAMSPDGQHIWVLIPQTGEVLQYGADGTLQDTIQVVQQGAAGHGSSMLSELALSPDGSTLAIPVTDSQDSWLAEVDLRAATHKPIAHESLGHARRIQGVRWDEDGSGVYVTAVNSMIKFDRRGLPVSWTVSPHNFVDVEGLPGSDEAVVVTPTFNAERGSGGLAVLAANGDLLRSVELPDMSPFVVAVRP